MSRAISTSSWSYELGYQPSEDQPLKLNLLCHTARLTSGSEQTSYQLAFSLRNFALPGAALTNRTTTNPK